MKGGMAEWLFLVALQSYFKWTYALALGAGVSQRQIFLPILSLDKNSIT